ncbi:MAG: protein kinase, partial [Gammaproteobacteria bacterium]|nr:protein kinase [Gammaproteobacteria bacterium]
RPGSVADNATRLRKDSEATEHTVMTVLGKDFTVSGTETRGTAPGDIFKRPFTEDEIAGADVTALQGLDPGAARDGEFGPGYMLRGRFQLTTKLGEGGMGAVWRARDMLKVRARDRNPYVAIKLLSGDFREHPEAFIALQRETSKQQRLAHPNVATVFDFDRDEKTNTVFMTMEAMEGQSMDKFIKKLPDGGLSVSDAMPIIEQVGAGLSYAHQNGLVHSDLKPGNCFVTKEGVVKLLDFGIARASKTESHAEGEKTLFDPGKLGAITPTYASVEMFEGLEPDPRDDIYALAIMAYQLFTGKHPYGKQNALKAMTMELAPPYVAKLSKRQNRGLARGLAFKREHRTKTVEQFLEEIRPRQSRVSAYVGVGTAALLLIAALAYEPVMDAVRAEQNEAIIAQIERGNMAGVSVALEKVRSLESFTQKSEIMENPRTVAALAALISGADDRQVDETIRLLNATDARLRQDLFNAPAFRSAVFEVFERRVRDAFSPGEGALDFAVAETQVKMLDGLYPQSAAVLSMTTDLKSRRDEFVAELEGRFESLLEQGAIVASESETDIGDVLQQIGAVSPRHPLLTDDRLRFRAAELAEQALKTNDAAAAERYVDAGLRFAPDDATLINLRLRARSTVESQERERMIAEAEKRLSAVESSLASLEDFRAHQRDLLALSVLEPGNALALKLSERHQSLFDAAFSAALRSGRGADAGSLLGSHAEVLDTAYLIDRRRELSAAGAAPDVPADRLEAIGRQFDASATDLKGFVEVLGTLRALLADADPDDAAIVDLRARAAAALIEKADRAASEEQFQTARRWIARARMADPASSVIESMGARVEQLETAALKRRERERKLAELESTRGRLEAAIRSDRPELAESLLNRLLALAESATADGDEQALRMADTYADLGEAYAAAENFEAAARMAAAGLAAYPRSERLEASLARYRSELDRRALLLALRSRFDSLEPLDTSVTEKDLAELRQQFPGRFDEFRGEFSDRRLARLTDFVQSPGFDPAALELHWKAFRTLFPHRAGGAAITLARQAARRIESERERDALAARTMLDEVSKALPAAPELDRLSGELPPAPVLRARRFVEAGRLNAAAKELENARSGVAALPESKALELAIAERRRVAMQKFEAFVDNVRKGLLTTRESRQRAFDEVLALWSDNAEFTSVDYVNREPGACLPDLAGSGRGEDGICYDLVAKDVRGPVLVVIPPAGSDLPAFAIGKYEVTVAEYNVYCNSTGACAPVASENDKLPITGISVRDAMAYAAWLSGRASTATGKSVVYRLPGLEEWRHAATANGALPTRGVNCRPEGGASLSTGLMRSDGGTLSLGVPIGRALVSAAFGGENGWGMVNVVGNAQEWVTADGELAASGGAFKDPLAVCSVLSKREHDGTPDAITSFRVLRELN